MLKVTTPENAIWLGALKSAITSWRTCSRVAGRGPGRRGALRQGQRAADDELDLAALVGPDRAHEGHLRAAQARAEHHVPLGIDPQANAVAEAIDAVRRAEDARRAPPRGERPFPREQLEPAPVLDPDPLVVQVVDPGAPEVADEGESPGTLRVPIAKRATDRELRPWPKTTPGSVMGRDLRP